MKTFAELYCAEHGISADDFAGAIFWRCLHRRGLLFAPCMRLLNDDYFMPDYEFILAAGRITTIAGLKNEIADFEEHPWNRASGASVSSCAYPPAGS